MDELYFVTGNKGKVGEAQAILGFPVQIADIDLDEVQSLDPEYVVRKKVEAAYAVLQKPLFVDDVSLHVNAWGGFPGPLVKHVRFKGDNELLLKLLQQEDDRSVVVKAIIGFHDGEKVHTFTGELEAEIVREERGERGWGFDSIIIPKGDTRTWAEMTLEEKNRTTHRRKALDKFKQYLEERGLMQGKRV